MKRLFPLQFAVVMSVLPHAILLSVSSNVKALFPGASRFRHLGQRHLGQRKALRRCILPSTRRVSQLSTSAKELPARAQDSSELVVTLSVPSANDLEELGALLAVISYPPDVFFLDGGT
jgi:hypothetical protein